MVEIFKKVLSLNDTGETGGHMGGILVPKADITFFPPLPAEDKNPRAAIEARDESGTEWNLNFIYYNNHAFGGTRNEYRLTGLTAFIASNRLQAGDMIFLRRDGLEKYQISAEKAASASSPKEGLHQQTLELPQGLLSDAPSLTDSHELRPAARIVHTIGANLIKDAEAAIIELVKNSYDADATEVRIDFNKRKLEGTTILRIGVTDNGHGMSHDSVVNTWLVPATEDKVRRRVSPGGRSLQGNKGIGRFAAFLLGDEIFMQTIKDGEETTLLLQASDFRERRFLDEVQVLVESRPSQREPGSQFEMELTDDSEIFRDWRRQEFEKLRTDLRRMLFPFRTRDEEFRVVVSYAGFVDVGMPDGFEEIEPLPVFDFFDYRITAQVDSFGRGTGKFITPLTDPPQEENISFTIENLIGKDCGKISADIRVVDRETGAIQGVLSRASSEGEMWSMNRAQLKKLLDEACGISVFRGDFRIRPYGDLGDDWLSLDSKRINNPSLKISNNQTFGLVGIEDEKSSHLQEKSARDGLRQDEHYERFQQIVGYIVTELERRRWDIRREVGRVQAVPKVEQMLAKLRQTDKTAGRVAAFLQESGVAPEKVEEVQEIILENQAERDSITAQLRDSIAMYQGQATLGKMVSVLLHEGNRDLGIIRGSLERIPKWRAILVEPTLEYAKECIEGEVDAVQAASSSLVDLFDRVKPLGVRARGKSATFALRKAIETVVKAVVGSREITVIYEIPSDYEITAWKQDFNAIILNLLDNSISWLERSKIATPTIEFRLVEDEDGRRLDVVDNGPGIPKEHIDSGAIFEPHFSLKEGTGIGLPIAGEAAERNGFTLRAWHMEGGAHFTLDFYPIKK